MHILGKRTGIAAGVIALGALASVVMLTPKTQLRADELTSLIIMGEKVELSSKNFPDSTFRAELKKYDQNNDGYLQKTEISSIMTLDLEGTAVKDLTGIGYLSSLENLYCSGCDITELDLEGCDALKNLDCSNTNLAELDVTLLDELVTLNISGTKITDLHLCQNRNLELLDCSNTNKKTLNINFIRTL